MKKFICRRDFVQGAAVAATGAAVGGFSFAQHAASPRPLVELHGGDVKRASLKEEWKEFARL